MSADVTSAKTKNLILARWRPYKCWESRVIIRSTQVIYQKSLFQRTFYGHLNGHIIIMRHSHHVRCISGIFKGHTGILKRHCPQDSYGHFSHRFHPHYPWKIRITFWNEKRIISFYFKWINNHCVLPNFNYFWSLSNLGECKKVIFQHKIKSHYTINTGHLSKVTISTDILRSMVISLSWDIVIMSDASQSFSRGILAFWRDIVLRTVMDIFHIVFTLIAHEKSESLFGMKSA
jgi:hypothetical protein